MYKIITAASVAAVLLGIVPNADAQSRSKANSAAALSGIESRSIQLQSSSNIQSSNTQNSISGPAEPTPITKAVRSTNPVDNQVVYDQLNNDVDVVISPVKEDRELFDSSSAGITGNNRIQVLFQSSP